MIRYPLIALMLSTLAGLMAASSSVTTIAGTGIGDGAEYAQDALTVDPAGAYVDEFGDRIFIVERGAHRVRQMAIGEDFNPVATVLGTGQAGSTVNPTNALLTELNQPADVLYDGVYIYVLDAGNNRIVRLDQSSGAVVVLVGSGGIDTTELNNPQAFCFDGNGYGNIFIADTGNHRILRLVDPRNANGGLNVTGYAGLTATAGNSGDGGTAAAAQFDAPAGLAYDHIDEVLYIADTNNNRIRLITDGIVFNYSGDPQGTAGTANDLVGDANRYNRPTQMQWDGLNGADAPFLFIVDSGNHRLCSIAKQVNNPFGLDAGQMRVAVGTGSAGMARPAFTTAGLGVPLRNPVGLAVDRLNANMTIYVCDTGNHQVHEVTGSAGDDLGNQVRNWGGTGSTTYAGDSVYISDARNAAFSRPVGITNAFGDYLIADTGNHRVRRLVPSEGTYRSVHEAGDWQGPGLGGNGNFPDLITMNEPRAVISANEGQYIFIADSQNAVVWEINNFGEGYSATIVASLEEFLMNPAALAVIDQKLYIADSGNHTIIAYDYFEDVAQVVVGSAGATGLGGNDVMGVEVAITAPNALASDGSNLYFTSGQQIFVYDTYSERIFDVAGSLGDDPNTLFSSPLNWIFGAPSGLAYHEGDLLVADSVTHSIVRIDLDNDVLAPFAGTGVAGLSAEGLPMQSSTFNQPQHLWAEDNRCFVADAGNDAIRLITWNPGDGPDFVGSSPQTVAAVTDGPGVAIDLSANDPSSPTLNWLVVSPPSFGNLSDPTIGAQTWSATYTPDPGFVGNDMVVVLVYDEQGLYDRMTITIPVAPPAVVVTASTAAEVTEGDVISMTVSLDTATTVAVDVTFAVTGGDLPAGEFTVVGPWSIPAGDTSATATITTTADTVAELDGVVIFTPLVTTTAPFTLDPTTVTVTQLDDDVAQLPAAATVGMMVAGTSVSEGGTISLTLSLDQALENAVTVNLTASGGLTANDFTSLGPFTIPAGTTSQIIELTASQNAIVDGDRSGALIFGTVTGATAGTDSLDLMIIDDDVPAVPPQVAFGPDGLLLFEGQTGHLTIMLDRPAASDVSVTVAVSQGGDLSPADLSIASAVIPVGSSSTALLVTAVDDDLVEGGEIGSVTITGASGAELADDLSRTIDLRDNDATPQALAITLLDGAEANALIVGGSYRAYIYGGSGLYTISSTGPLSFQAGSPLNGTYDLNGDGVIDVGQVILISPTAAGSATLAIDDAGAEVGTDLGAEVGTELGAEVGTDEVGTDIGTDLQRRVAPAAATLAVQATALSATAQPQPTVAQSTAGQTVFTAIAGTSPERIAALVELATSNDATTFKAGAWDAANQQFVQLPTLPAGGILAGQGIFVATRLPIDLLASGTPSPVPFRVSLLPGWNFIGIPVFASGAAAIDLANFDLRDEAGIAITGADRTALIGSDAKLWDGNGYSAVTTLSSGRGYWIQNTSSDPSQALSLVLTTDPALLAAVATRTSQAQSKNYRHTSRSDDPPSPEGDIAPADAADQGCGIGMLSLLPLLMGLGLLRFSWVGRRRED